MSTSGPGTNNRGTHCARRLLLIAGVWLASGGFHSSSIGAGSGGPTYYFSDCQAGASAGCVPGNNANAGNNPSAPKQDLKGLNVNALPAGTRLLFAQGGAWTNFNVQLLNLNATPTNPLVFDSYAPPWGGNTRPWLKVSGMFFGFQFGPFNDTVNDGGYTVRNLKLDGQGIAGAWGFHLRNAVRHVTLENLEITGFELAIHSQGNVPPGNTHLTIRNNLIHRNSEMGLLGDAFDVLIEGNTFADNNFSGSTFNHAIYLSGEGRNGIVRGNTLVNNSVKNGTCTGGNLTVHGQWENLLVENNTITQVASGGGCYGVSINPAYNSPEWFRKLVVRGNTIVNLGGCSICLTSAPGALVEGNRIYNDQGTYQTGILIPDRSTGPGDDADAGAIVRNNTIYFPQAGEGSTGVNSRAGNKLEVSSNLIFFGPRSHPKHQCFVHSDRANYAAFAGNACFHASNNGAWSRAHTSLSAAQASGFDTNGLNGDPGFTMAPSGANAWRCRVNNKSLVTGACEREGP